jgi:hypothetical protein
MRTLVIGGSGNFGGRIVRALRSDAAMELFVAGRHRRAGAVPAVTLDIRAPDFAEQLRALSPELVIHCVGPFQGQDYRVAKATLGAGAHYVDLADGREFVTGFAAQMNELAIAAGRVAISGASTLPGLSSAVVEHLQEGLSRLESIQVIIAPGNRAPRGEATLAAVFSYLGCDFPVLHEGRWKRVWGWMDLRRLRLDIGWRLAAACDVPDLTLFPARFPGVQSVNFHATLEFGVQHLALWILAALRRSGLPLRVDRWAIGLNRFAGMFDAIAGDQGGMLVSVVGQGSGGRVRRTWQLIAPAQNGPEIPCMAAILLARRLANGEPLAAGASACIGFLKLSAFGPEFSRWGITTRLEATSD